MAEFWIEVVEMDGQFVAKVRELIAHNASEDLLGSTTSGFQHRGMALVKRLILPARKSLRGCWRIWVGQST